MATRQTTVQFFRMEDLRASWRRPAARMICDMTGPGIPLKVNRLEVWLVRYGLWFWTRMAIRFGLILIAFLLASVNPDLWWVPWAVIALTGVRMAALWRRDTRVTRLCLHSPALQRLNALDAAAFRCEVARMLKPIGYQVHESDEEPILTGNSPQGDSVIVACRQRSITRIIPKMMVHNVRNLAAAMVDRKVQRGLIVTTWLLTTEARILAGACGITVLDGLQLMKIEVPNESVPSPDNSS
jgi:hypothetical protein